MEWLGWETQRDDKPCGGTALSRTVPRRRSNERKCDGMAWSCFGLQRKGKERRRRAVETRGPAQSGDGMASHCLAKEGHRTAPRRRDELSSEQQRKREARHGRDEKSNGLE